MSKKSKINIVDMAKKIAENHGKGLTPPLDLTQSLDNFRNENKELKQKLGEMQQEIERLKQETQSQKIQLLEKHIREISQYIQDKSLLLETVDNTTAQLSTASYQLEKMKKFLEEIEHDKNLIKFQLEQQIKERVDDLTKSKEHWKKELEAQARKHEEEMKKLKEDMDKIQQENNLLKEKAKEKSEQLKSPAPPISEDYKKQPQLKGEIEESDAQYANELEAEKRRLKEEAEEEWKKLHSQAYAIVDKYKAQLELRLEKKTRKRQKWYTDQLAAEKIRLKKEAEEKGWQDLQALEDYKDQLRSQLEQEMEKEQKKKEVEKPKRNFEKTIKAKQEEVYEQGSDERLCSEEEEKLRQVPATSAPPVIGDKFILLAALKRRIKEDVQRQKQKEEVIASPQPERLSPTSTASTVDYQEDSTLPKTKKKKKKKKKKKSSSVASDTTLSNTETMKELKPALFLKEIAQYPKLKGYYKIIAKSDLTAKDFNELETQAITDPDARRRLYRIYTKHRGVTKLKVEYGLFSTENKPIDVYISALSSPVSEEGLKDCIRKLQFAAGLDKTGLYFSSGYPPAQYMLAELLGQSEEAGSLLLAYKAYESALNSGYPVATSTRLAYFSKQIKLSEVSSIVTGLGI